MTNAIFDRIAIDVAGGSHRGPNARTRHLYLLTNLRYFLTLNLCRSYHLGQPPTRGNMPSGQVDAPEPPMQPWHPSHAPHHMAAPPHAFQAAAQQHPRAFPPPPPPEGPTEAHLLSELRAFRAQEQPTAPHMAESPCMATQDTLLVGAQPPPPPDTQISGTPAGTAPPPPQPPPPDMPAPDTNRAMIILSNRENSTKFASAHITASLTQTARVPKPDPHLQLHRIDDG